MSNYAENKKKLDEIRQKYGCKGEVLFRTAIQYVVEYGRDLLNDCSWFKGQMCSIDAYHDKAEMEGKTLWVTRGFEKAILECAKELAQIEAYDFLTYIQREVWLGGDGINYQRAIKLCKNVIDCTLANVYETEYALNEIREMGFSDDEIDELGFGWMLDAEMEE